MTQGPSSPPAATAPDIDDLISPECQEIIRREIASVAGSEVFFVGRLDRAMVVEEVEAYAFGNRQAVPALMQYARAGDVIIHNHPSGHLEPSGADIEISSTLGERGVGSYIVNNDCTAVRPVVRAMRPKTLEAVDENRLAAMLEPGGRIAESMASFEHRPEQIQMLRAVTRAFNEDGIAVIEAGTGTGKSMAYLVPAIAWSLRNQEKVVVSTHTINLQEQLIEKDLPLLRSAMGVEFDAVLVKGRNNYLCLRKTDYLRKTPEFFEIDEKRRQLQDIIEWSRNTRDGSLADLSFTPESEVWDRVMSESDNCLRTRCPFYQKCFYYSARRRASRAHVLVANHHLLMADLAVRAETGNYNQAAVLPPFHRVILDEAHHVEDVATSYFGSRVSRAGILFSLRRLASSRSGAGLLYFISARIHNGDYRLGPDLAARWMQRISINLMHEHQELANSVDEVSDRISMAMDEEGGGRLDSAAEFKPRITGEFMRRPLWENEIVPGLRSILGYGRTYLESLRGLHRVLLDSVEEETPENMSPILELESVAGRLDSHLRKLIRFLAGEEEDCRWIEYRRRGAGRRSMLTFCTAPLDIAGEIRDKVLTRYRTVALTSATMTVEREFDYVLRRLGADDPARLSLTGPSALESAARRRAGSTRRCEPLLLDSPFDYDRQVIVGVPQGLPLPTEPDFAGELSEFLTGALRATDGRAFILFTSWRMLEQVADRLAPRLEPLGITCLRQGTGGRTLLTENFRSDVRSVLFGTASFWEGVDVPGEALSCVVITRLPFAVPNDPVIEARVEAMKRDGIDPFDNYLVPQAVIRFRQGFGRLIRSRRDRGAVLICDRRVMTARYGRKFLNSLPTRRVEFRPGPEITRSLAEFFSDGNSVGEPPDPVYT